MEYTIKTRTIYQPNDYVSYISKDKNEHPFDESLIPVEYKHFPNATVNNDLYKELRKNLDELKTPFEKELGGLNSNNEYITYKSNDWESELCYLQGKYMEHVSWEGEAPPFCCPEEGKLVVNVTYRKLSPGELAYYLYWRTEIKKEHYTVGFPAAFYMFLYELVIGIGEFDTEITIKYMNCLKEFSFSHMKIQSMIDRMKIEYENCHLVTNINLYQRPKSKWREEWQIIPYEVAHKKYSHAFEFMDKISTYRLPASKFVKEKKCKEQIGQCILILLPKLDKLFSDHNLSLSDFLTGKIEVGNKALPYRDSIWTEYTRRRVLNNNFTPSVLYNRDNKIEVFLSGPPLHNRTVKQKINYAYDVNLTNFIFQKIESEFRKYMGYTALKVEIPKGYKYKTINGEVNAVPVDKKLRKEWERYYALFPDISNTIISAARGFVKNSKAFKSLSD